MTYKECGSCPYLGYVQPKNRRNRIWKCYCKLKGGKELKKMKECIQSEEYRACTMVD